MNLCIDCKHHREPKPGDHQCHHPATASPVTGEVGWPCYKLRWEDTGNDSVAHGGNFNCGPGAAYFEPKDSHAAVHAAVRRSG